MLINRHHGSGYLIYPEQHLSMAEAEQLADSLGLALVSQSQATAINDGFKLVYSAGLWRAHLADGKTVITIDFTNSKMLTRLKPNNLAGEYVVRAVLGRKKVAQMLTVLDATAGFGQDAFLLAAAGCQVTMIEQLPLLQFLLRQALRGDTYENSDVHQNTDAEEIVDAYKTTGVRDVLARLQLLCGNSIELMRNWQQARPDIIYLDPMYAQPQSGATGLKKSAAVKKNMAFLHMLSSQNASVSSDVDLYGSGMLTEALTLATAKVVVKRAPNADWLDDIKPASSITGKAARFDIYPVSAA